MTTFLLSGQSQSANSTGGVKARYVKILKTLSVPQDALHVNELEVFDSTGANVAKGKVVTADSFYDANTYPAKAATDGNYATMWHSGCSAIGCKAWMQVDLGQTVNILAIRILNRQDPCCRFRSVGVYVQALDESQNAIFASDPTTQDAPAYNIYPPDTRPYPAAYGGYQSGNTYNTAYVRLNLPTSSKTCPAACGAKGTVPADSICIPGFFDGPCPDPANIACDGPVCPADTTTLPTDTKSSSGLSDAWKKLPKWAQILIPIAGGLLLLLIVVGIFAQHKKRKQSTETFRDIVPMYSVYD